MKSSSDRGMTYAKAPPIAGPDLAMTDGGGSGESADLIGSLWRYRWAVILPSMAGLLIGFLVYVRTPETYRATTRLIVESDRPAILDTMTGDVIGGVPGIDLVRSQLFGDQVGEMAFKTAAMTPYQGDFSDWRSFVGRARGSLKLEGEISDSRSAQSLVFLMHFENTNAQLCEAAVKAYSEALEQYFNERQKSSRNELIRLITEMKEYLHPKMELAEENYRKFRSTAPLAWDSEGDAINPHRERQLFLVEKRSELVEQLRQKEIETVSVEAIIAKSKDPTLALDVLSQILNVAVSTPSVIGVDQNLQQSDVQLAEIEFNKQLIPLMIERNKVAAQFGDNHPTVKDIDAELEMMRGEFRRLVHEQSQRIGELIEAGRTESTDPAERAKNALNAIVFAAKAQISLLNQQIADVEELIDDEKGQAIELARFEQENLALLRQIERNRELMDQVEEQMARVSLTEEEGGTRVNELTAPTGAYRVGPNLSRMLGIGGILGLALGAGLAFLLEKNANTFRDPDEVSQSLGVPVLTHVPFFRGRTRRAKKGEAASFADIDPYLTVVHQPASVASEAIRSCRTSIFFEMAGEGGKAIQITSPLPGDGKSTIAGNLACSIAQSGKRVVALDCDLWRPQLSDNFSKSDDVGLTNVLNGECEPHEAIHETPVSNLFVMPSGPIPANPAEALTLKDMSELIDLLRDQFDYVIVDTPPLLVVTDPSITASLVDGVVMAMRVRRKSKPNSRESMNILSAVGARVLGIVINNSDEAGASDGYRGYGYYRYGRYTSRYHRYGKTGGYYSRGYSRGSSQILVSGRGAASTPVDAATVASDTNDDV